MPNNSTELQQTAVLPIVLGMVQIDGVLLTQCISDRQTAQSFGGQRLLSLKLTRLLHFKLAGRFDLFSFASSFFVTILSDVSDGAFKSNTVDRRYSSNKKVLFVLY